MAKTADKMICPSCGVEMNHHSDKVVYGACPQEMQEPGPVDTLLGGVINEFHTCPKCGSAASRNA